MDKKKIIKLCLIFLAIILLVLCIYYGRNYYIVSKIEKMQEKYMNATNYSLMLVPEKLEDKPEVTVEQYYKGGKSKQVVRSDGEEVMTIYYEPEKKEQIQIFPKGNTASIEFSDSSFICSIPILSNNMAEKLMWTFISKISSAEVNGEECYLIDWGAKIYISKESGLKVKEINGKSVDADGTEHESVQYIKDVKLDYLKDEDVKAPSLEGYKVTDYRENQKKFGGW